MCRFYKIRIFSVVYIRNEILRVSVDHGEPATLNLYHYSMSFPEHMIYLVQPDHEFFRFTGNQGFGVCETLSEFSPEHFHGDRQLITA